MKKLAFCLVWVGIVIGAICFVLMRKNEQYKQTASNMGNIKAIRVAVQDDSLLQLFKSKEKQLKNQAYGFFFQPYDQPIGNYDLAILDLNSYLKTCDKTNFLLFKSFECPMTAIGLLKKPNLVLAVNRDYSIDNPELTLESLRVGFMVMYLSDDPLRVRADENYSLYGITQKPNSFDTSIGNMFLYSIIDQRLKIEDKLNLLIFDTPLKSLEQQRFHLADTAKKYGIAITDTSEFSWEQSFLEGDPIRIAFRKGSAQVTSDMTAINKVISEIKGSDFIGATITGHISKVGDYEANKKLAIERASIISNNFSKSGVPSTRYRIEVTSASGEMGPCVTVSTFKKAI